MPMGPPLPPGPQGQMPYPPPAAADSELFVYFSTVTACQVLDTGLKIFGGPMVRHHISVSLAIYFLPALHGVNFIFRPRVTSRPESLQQSTK